MPNSIWSGAVTFGLVSIPIRLYPATESKDIRFNLLHRKDHSRIHQRYYCPEDGEIVEWYDLVRGYEASPGRYVAMTDEDFASLPIASLKAIEIECFVPLESIDPIHFQQTYFLEPEELGMKPFALLIAALRQSGLVVIARFTLRTKEHACVLRCYENTLALSPLLYSSEVKPAAVLKTPDLDEVDPENLALAKAYIEALTVPFEHAAYRDSYRDALQARIDDKARELEPAKEPVPAASALPDLMNALREAVAKTAARQAKDKRVPV